MKKFGAHVMYLPNFYRTPNPKYHFELLRSNLAQSASEKCLIINIIFFFFFLPPGHITTLFSCAGIVYQSLVYKMYQKREMWWLNSQYCGSGRNILVQYT